MSSVNTFPAVDTERISVESELRRMNAYIRVLHILEDKVRADKKKKELEEEAEGGDLS